MSAASRACCLLLAGIVTTSVPRGAATGQETAGREHLEKGRQLAMAGDTSSAVAELERAIEVAPDLADAHYEIGRLLTHRASAIETDFTDRKKAEDALLRALELESRNPYYLLELGRLRLKQHMRVDAERLLNRALDEARKQGSPGVLADVHFALGYIQEHRYQGMRDRRMSLPFRGPPAAEMGELFTERIERYTNRYLDRHPQIDGYGDHTAELMLEHYREALRHDRYHIEAAIRLMGYLLDQHRMAEYLSIARRLVEQYPGMAEPHLYLGLGLHTAGREEEAGRAFEDGLSRLSRRDREAIESLAPVLRRDAADRYLEMEGAERDEFESSYWRLRDPLYLTDANEGRLEHLSRVAYADLRFAAPSSGAQGWETDRGIIYIRYGAPREVGVFGASQAQSGDPFAGGRRSIVWSYGRDGPVFVFRQMPGYLNARFAGDYEFIAEEYRHIQPSRYDRIPSISELYRVPIQLARFRGDGPDDIAVEIHAGLPVDSLARGVDLQNGAVQVGMFLLNSAGQTVVRRVRSERLRYADPTSVERLRSWRILMPEGGPLVAAVEARDELSWRSATARDTFTAAAFRADSFSISDILVADHLVPLVEEPAERSDLDIVPNPELAFEPDDPVHIYYELYGLQPDDEGFASFDVALAVRVKSLTRGGPLSDFLGSIADAWGFSIVGDDRLELRYNRQVRVADRDRVTEFLKIELKEAPAGEYEIRLRVWDRNGEELASRTRTLQVIDHDSPE